MKIFILLLSFLSPLLNAMDHSFYCVYIGPELSIRAHTEKHITLPCESHYFRFSTRPYFDTSAPGMSIDHSYFSTTTQDPLVQNLITLQLNGDLPEMIKTRNEIQSELNATLPGFGRKPLQTQLDKIDSFINADLTQKLSTVSNGSLSNAYKTLQEMKDSEIYNQPYSGASYETTNEPINILKVAEILFQHRSDYPNKDNHIITQKIPGTEGKPFGYSDQKKTITPPLSLSLPTANDTPTHIQQSTPKPNTRISIFERIRNCANFIHKDSWSPLSKPDMANDQTMANIQTSYDRLDIAMLYHHLTSELKSINDAPATSIVLDRHNLYKSSRRLSLILKHINNPILQSMIAIYKTDSFAKAQVAYNTLSQELSATSEIKIKGMPSIALDQNKIAKILEAAQLILKNRSDYTPENIPFGGQLPPIAYHQDPILKDPVSSPQEPFINDLLTPLTDPLQDIKITNALDYLQSTFGEDFFRHRDTINGILQELKNQNLIDKPIDEIKNAIGHGINHFLKELTPTNPLENPAEHVAAATKYCAIAIVHIITKGALLAPEKLLYLSTQLDLLSKTDLSKLTANQKAEHIATKAADIIKTVLAERAGKYIASKIPLPSAPTHSPTPQTVAELTTADGSTFKVTIEDETSILKNASDKVPINKSVTKIEEVKWHDYFKHKPPANKSWKDIVNSTRNNDALYRPGLKIEDLERYAWNNGIPTTNGKNWKVFKFDKIIGANSGKETYYIRVECSANTIHGHPILESKYLELIK